MTLAPHALFAAPPQTPPGKAKRPPLPPGQGGHGKGTGGRTSLPVPAAGGGSGSPTSAVVLAAWLDDAETLGPGEATLGIGVGRSESLDGSETDAPVLDAAVGVASRVQLSLSLPYYRASYDDGYAASGRGNTYLACKLQLLAPDAHAVGLAVTPMLEVLSDASLSDTTLGLSRVNWVLPLSAQFGRGRTKAFATAGYFSRGALSLAGGVAHSASTRVTLMAALSYMYSTHASEATDLAGLSRSRLDASGSLVVQLTPALSVSGAVGRTVSSLDQNGAKLLLSANVSYAFSRAQKRP